MMVYVYRCADGHEKEVKQKLNEPPYQCPCGSETKRVIQPVLVKFKGEGFYVNDNKS